MFGSRLAACRRAFLAPAGAAVVSASSMLSLSTAEQTTAHATSRLAFSSSTTKATAVAATMGSYTTRTQMTMTTSTMMMQRLLSSKRNAAGTTTVSLPMRGRPYANMTAASTTTTSLLSTQPRVSVVVARSRGQQPFHKSPFSTKTTRTTTPNTTTHNHHHNNNGSSTSLMAWYEQQLHTRPVMTKMVTGGCLWSLGDAVAQYMPAVAAGHALPSYDWPRTGRAALFGFALHAPTSHVHFNFLEWLTIRTGVTGNNIPLFKAFMEQFVYWSWISNSMYHGAMGALQGQSTDQIYHRIADNLWETQKAQWIFWIPVQLINFKFVPVRHQLNVVLVVSILWTALLSAWYPPEKQQEESATNTSTVESASATTATMKRTN